MYLALGTPTKTLQWAELWVIFTWHFYFSSHRNSKVSIFILLHFSKSFITLWYAVDSGLKQIKMCTCIWAVFTLAVWQYFSFFHPVSPCSFLHSSLRTMIWPTAVCPLAAWGFHPYSEKLFSWVVAVCQDREGSDAMPQRTAVSGSIPSGLGYLSLAILETMAYSNWDIERGDRQKGKKTSSKLWMSSSFSVLMVVPLFSKILPDLVLWWWWLPRSSIFAQTKWFSMTVSTVIPAITVEEKCCIMG